MARYAPPTQMEPKNLRVLARSIREIADQIDANADAIDSTSRDSLWVFGAPTLQDGIKKLRSFVTQLQMSLDATLSGQDYSAASRKTNHGVVTPSELTEADEAEAKRIAEEGLKDIQRAVLRDQHDRSSGSAKNVGTKSQKRTRSRKNS